MLLESCNASAEMFVCVTLSSLLNAADGVGQARERVGHVFSQSKEYPDALRMRTKRV